MCDWLSVRLIFQLVKKIKNEREEGGGRVREMKENTKKKIKIKTFSISLIILYVLMYTLANLVRYDK